MEGKRASVQRLGQLVHKDVPRAGLKEFVGEVAERAAAADWETALVVNREGILLGRLYKAQLDGDPNLTAEAAMEHGPSTYRPDVDVTDMADLMRNKDLDTAPVTTSEGVVLGMVLRTDLEKS